MTTAGGHDPRLHPNSALPMPNGHLRIINIPSSGRRWSKADLGHEDEEPIYHAVCLAARVHIHTPVSFSANWLSRWLIELLAYPLIINDYGPDLRRRIWNSTYDWGEFRMRASVHKVASCLQYIRVASLCGSLSHNDVIGGSRSSIVPGCLNGRR